MVIMVKHLKAARTIRTMQISTIIQSHSGQDSGNKTFLLDFAFTSYKYSQRYFLYPVDANIDPAEANLSTIKNMFTLTFGYKFGI